MLLARQRPAEGVSLQDAGRAHPALSRHLGSSGARQAAPTGPPTIDPAVGRGGQSWLIQVLDALRRRLAEIEHERWADWQRWMHDQCAPQPNGDLVIPAPLVERWERQIRTPFEQLSEAEQHSDLEQVDRYWPLIAPALAANWWAN